VTGLSDVISQEQEMTWGYTDETSQVIVKPTFLPAKYVKQFNTELLLIEDSEYITVLVGS